MVIASKTLKGLKKKPFSFYYSLAVLCASHFEKVRNDLSFHVFLVVMFLNP